MNNSIAIIQPSLFEGWSTVVEDAKALNKLYYSYLDLEVHREQINNNAYFFNPHEEILLAKALEKYVIDKPITEKIELFK